MNKLRISGGLIAAALLWVSVLSLLSGDSEESVSQPAGDGSQAEITFIDKSQFYTDGSGEVALRMEIIDADGDPMLGLSKQKVHVTEEGIEAPLKTLHGPGTQPINVILVIDVSGSMSGAKLRDAQDAALAALNELQIGRDRIGVIAFSSGMRVIHPLSDLTNDSLRDCQNQLRSLNASGGTQIGPPTLRALELFGQADSDGPKLLMVMTDGEDDDLAALVDRIVTSSDTQGVPVFTIAFGEEIAEAKAVLQDLASRCEGKYYFAPTGDELARIYRSQVQEVGKSFIAIYDSPWPQADGLPRQVEVTVDSNAGELSAGRSYHIGPLITGGQRSAPRLPDGTVNTAGSAGGTFLKIILFLFLAFLLAGGLAASELSSQLRLRLGATTTPGSASVTAPVNAPQPGTATPSSSRSVPPPPPRPATTSVLAGRFAPHGTPSTTVSPPVVIRSPPPPPQVPGKPTGGIKAPSPPKTGVQKTGVQKISPITPPPPPATGGKSS